MFDATIQVVGLEVLKGDDHAVLVAVVGLALPTPQGPMPVPAGNFRVPMSKETAMELAQKLGTVAADLPDTKAASDLIVAGNLDGVDKAARINEQFKGQ